MGQCLIREIAGLAGASGPGDRGERVADRGRAAPGDPQHAGAAALVGRAADRDARPGDRAARLRADRRPRLPRALRAGLDEFDRAHDRAVKAARGDRTATEQIRALTATAREWQAHARISVGQVERTGPKAASIAETRTRKTLMALLRIQDAALRRHLERRTETELQHARWIVFGFVLLFGGGILAFGMIVVERQARRDRQRSVQRREYVEALQGADDELEAKELLRRRAERAVPTAEAVVLTRNASGNSLDTSTDPSAVDGLAEALTHATPRSCLAIRRGRMYEREPGSEPLQSCELCGKGAGAALCVPSLVGGEVIGSLLVMKRRPFKPGERDGITATVGQAAPVLANLRNLAIAEHRAATDPLTRLPNARSVQETLIRMVAQSHRTHSPLSAHRPRGR